MQSRHAVWHGQIQEAAKGGGARLAVPCQAGRILSCGPRALSSSPAPLCAGAPGAGEEAGGPAGTPGGGPAAAGPGESAAVGR